MLTRDEIEDSFEVHFRQQVEDLPDDELQAMLTDMRTLRKYAPPSLSASPAREIVAGALQKRHPPAQAPAPVEPPVELPEEAEVASEVAEAAIEQPVVEPDENAALAGSEIPATASPAENRITLPPLQPNRPYRWISLGVALAALILYLLLR